MAPRIALLSTRMVAFRAKPSIPQQRLAPRILQQRAASDDASNKSPESRDASIAQSPHVSEEQAALDKVMGKSPPDLTQGTPVQEILQRDKDAQKNAPEVLKQGVKQTSADVPSGKRSFSTSARRRELSAADAQILHPIPPSPVSLAKIEDTKVDGIVYPDAGAGHKFPLPDIATIARSDNLKRRYDPCVDQFTKSIMQHGKLSQAQANMSKILDTLRTSPAPQPNVQFPNRALLTSLPRDALPLYPIAYLTTVIDSLAPLIKIRQQRGVIGGGASLPVPMPMALRQRRRSAIQWILQSASNRRETKLADRVAKEIISVAEGKSGAWEKRMIVHKQGISARSNLKLSQGRRSKGRRF